MKIVKNKFQRFLLVFLFIFCGSIFFAQSASFYFNEGKSLQLAEDWYGAIEYFTEATRKNTSYGEAFFALAECFYAVDEYELSLSYLDSASTFLKNRADIMNLRGFCNIGLGNLGEAENIFASVLKSFPNDIDARFGLAELNILKGRISGAEKEYKQALSRQNTNKKALLSLALISDEMGNKEATQSYLNQALKYHSGNPEVYYFAAYIATKQGDLNQAEARIRTAIHLKSGYDKAYELLANILYKANRFEECIEICKYRITLDRSLSSAWYLRGLASAALNNFEDALTFWETGLDINPNDEVMRSVLELLALEYTDIEDLRREEWANYHFNKAKDYEKKFYSVQARYEYRRALRLNPMHTEARLAYAELLLSDGLKESYLSQLQFLVDLGPVSQKILDTIEGYNSLLANSLTVKWNTNPFYYDKKRWNIGIYFSDSEKDLYHLDAGKIATKYLEDLIYSSDFINGYANISASNNYTSAFSDARKNQFDYFGLLSFDETEREITVNLTLYSGRTGKEVEKWSVYRTGNDKLVSSLRYMLQKIESSLPVYGKIVNRINSDILIDIGQKDGVSENISDWLIVKKGAIKTADSGIGITFLEDDVLGTFSVENLGEEIASGRISQKGLYDKINIGDYVIPAEKIIPTEEILENQEIEENVAKKQPTLLNLLRDINN